MTMKKWMSALLATSMVAGLALTGCGSSDAGSGSADTTKGTEAGSEAAGESSSGTEEADKIIIFQSKVEIQDALEECAKAFTDETGIEVEVWGTPGDGYLQQLKTKLANNQGPTIFSQAGDTELESIQGYCLDVSDLEMLKDFKDGTLDSATVDGKIYGVPYTMEGQGLVYNTDLIDATTFTSVDDFINAIKEQNANGVEGFELSQEDYFLLGHILGVPFGLQEDPAQFVADLAEGKVKLADNEIFQEFADMLVQIRENCENPLNQNYDGEVGDLATGKAAMIHQGNWAGSILENDYEFSNAAIAPVPLAGNDKIIAAVPNYWTINASATPEEQAAAKHFLTWLYTSETGKSYLYDQFKFIPLIEGDTNSSLDCLSQSAQKYIDEGKTLVSVSSKWPANIVNLYVTPLAEEFFTSDMSAEDFLTNLDAKWAEAVANQG